MRRLARSLVATAVAASAPAVLPAQAPAAPGGVARFTGEWVLDTARSTRGPGMLGLTMHVRAEQGKLVVRRVAETPAGPVDVTFTYATDGSPSVNRTQQGGADIVVTTTTKDEAPALTLDSQIQTPAQTVRQVDRWTLAPGGGELAVARAMSVGNEQASMTFVFRRKAS